MPRSPLLLSTFCPRPGPPLSQLQPLSLLPPSSSLLGEVLAGGEQLLAHSSRAGGGRQGAGDSPASLRAPPGALGESGGTADHRRANNGLQEDEGKLRWNQDNCQQFSISSKAFGQRSPATNFVQI
ncbi:hypothetical protein NN561_006701 [Cricetulus griseus]